MLGAVIGDLAAWTYEHDRKHFWSHLVSNEAKVSEFGLSVLATAALISTDRNMPKEKAAKFTRQFFRNFNTDAVELSPEALDWTSLLECDYQSTMFGIGILRMTTSAFFDVPCNEMYFEGNWDKEEGYTRLFLSQMVTSLRQGKTKDEVYEELGNVFHNCRHHWNWQEENGMLSYLLRAWDAFYRAFDFTSAIHNAMKMNGDHCLMGAFTGAIAGAMYGCRYNMVKRKYQEEDSYSPYEYMTWPQALMRDYSEPMQFIEHRAVKERVFFPKNNAKTNVERHSWQNVENPFAKEVIDEEKKRSLLYAFEPDWDNRYGLYLENGWIYVYRSGFLLARFQLRKYQDGTYRMRNLQHIVNERNALVGLEEALYSLKKLYSTES
ncbi:MAG: ADP-ribosylglycohydrolase family protein [Alloprevotella sp.]|nr:ADP-ribosylglycohydrolase family protein [Alloprevotella sp.]